MLTRSVVSSTTSPPSATTTRNHVRPSGPTDQRPSAPTRTRVRGTKNHKIPQSGIRRTRRAYARSPALTTVNSGQRCRRQNTSVSPTSGRVRAYTPGTPAACRLPAPAVEACARPRQQRTRIER